MPDWILDFFNGSIFYNIGCSAWNASISFVYAILKQNPAGGTFSSVWAIVQALSNSLTSVGASLAALYFVIGFCRDSIDVRQDLNLNHTIKLFIRLLLTTGALVSSTSMIPVLFEWAIALTNINTAALQFDASSVMEITGADESFILIKWLLGLVFAFAAVACAFTLISSVCGRFFRLLMIVPLSTIGLAGFAGGGTFSQSGIAWIRTFLSYTFEIVVMALVLAMSGAFVENTTFFQTDDAILKTIELILKMIIVTSSVKGAEDTLRRALSL